MRAHVFIGSKTIFMHFATFNCKNIKVDNSFSQVLLYLTKDRVTHNIFAHNIEILR